MSTARLSLITQIPPQPSTKRGESVNISASPDGTRIVYAAGKDLIIRDVDDPSKSRIYAEHSKEVTCGKFSPNLGYVASGDILGNVHIWSPDQEEEFALKVKGKGTQQECIRRALGGEVKDLAWDMDSQRMLVCGSGQRVATAYNAFTGANLGQFIGSTKAMNSCDIRHTRPVTAIVAGDDFSSVKYECWPAKFNHTNRECSKFMTCARYSPDGKYLAISCATGQVLVYVYNYPVNKDNREPSDIIEIGKHDGGCYGLAWSKCGTKVASASADKTVRVWDVPAAVAAAESMPGFQGSAEERANKRQQDAASFVKVAHQEISKTVCGTATPDDQQLGICWTPSGQIISVGYNGDLNYIDENACKISRKVVGHQKAIGNVVASEGGMEFITSSAFDGCVRKWSMKNLLAEKIGGKDGKCAVKGLHAQMDGSFVAIGQDGKCKVGRRDYESEQIVEGEPCCSASYNDVTAIACVEDVKILRNGTVVASAPVQNRPMAIAMHENDVVVAGQGFCDLYKLNGGSLTLSGPIEEVVKNKGATSMAFNHAGSVLAVGELKQSGDKSLRLLQVAKGYSSEKREPIYPHTTKITSLSWSPNDEFLASSCIDQSICVWHTGKNKRKQKVDHAHRLQAVNSVAWLSDETLVSVDQNGGVKLWKADMEASLN